MPSSLEELKEHERSASANARAVDGWPLKRVAVNGWCLRPGAVQVSGWRLGLRQLALAGAGLARLAEFTVREDVSARRLLAVLEDLNPGDLEEVHAVYLGQAALCPRASAPSSISSPAMPASRRAGRGRAPDFAGNAPA